MNIDFFMKEALIEAKKAYKLDEVPIGGVIVDNFTKKIVARGHNRSNKNKIAIDHCEILLIIKACKKLEKKYLDDFTLFITLEPCTMCAAAISKAHIGKLYFGTYDEKNGGIEKFRIAYDRDNIFLPEIYGGILEKDCKDILKNYFKSKRI